MLTDKVLENLFNKLNKKCFENKLSPISVFFVKSKEKNNSGAGFLIFRDGNVCIVVEDKYKTFSKNDISHIILHEMVHYYLYSINKDPSHTVFFYDKLIECYKKFVDLEEAWRIIMIGMEHDGVKIKEIEHFIKLKKRKKC